MSFGFAGAVGLGLVVSVTKHNWCADEGVFFADFALQEALIRPVQELKTLKRFHRLVGRSQNVDESFVGPHLKLLAAVLVFMNCAQNGNDLLFGGQRDGTGHAGACALRSFNDLFRRRIHQLMIVTFEPDSDFFLDCHLPSPPVKFCAGATSKKVLHCAGCFVFGHLKTGEPRTAQLTRGLDG